MTTTRPVSPGKRRKCPHCRSEILESASICPACRHHLRFGEAAKQAGTRLSALHVEGTVRHPAGDIPWEYSVVIAIRNQKGEEVARQIVGIGAMQGADLRTFDLSVDVFVPETVSATPAASKDAPGSQTSVPQTPVAPTSTASTARRVAVKQDSTVSAARSVSPAPRQTSMISEARILPRRQTSTVSATRIISAPSQKESASKEPASQELSKKELSKQSSQKPVSSDKATNGSNRSSPRTPTKPSGS